jgi:hypothetical protein
MLPQLESIAQAAQQGAFLTRQDYAQQTAEQQTALWFDAHRGELYVNGQYDPANVTANLTPLGQEMFRLGNMGITDPDKALAEAKSHQAKAAGIRKPTKRAKRAAPARSAPQPTKSLSEVRKELIERTGSDDDLLAIVAGERDMPP